MAKTFKYLFRFCCDPYFNAEQEKISLLRLLDEVPIDDVMVFANVQEINTGHMSFEEQKTYIAFIKEIMDLAQPQGVTVSINQWHSLMHGDLGKKLRDDQSFSLMVDPYGNKSSLCVCPMDEEWRDYIAQLYSNYAVINPDTLWVEDDFRLHNHTPLIWGGCFCDEHMKLYSKLAGKPLTREEFVAGVLAVGKPHPYRKIWLDVSRSVMVENARIIGNAVHAVSPTIKLGLMSSAPHIHCAEGRDWHGILQGFAGENAPIDRIHLPGYSEPSAREYMMNFNAVSMLTRGLVPRNTQIFPELENFPFSRFAKSRRFTRFQLISMLPLDVDGTTIDLYDLNGNGICFEDGYQKMLSEVKPFLNHMLSLDVFTGDKAGIRVMFDEQSSYSILTNAGKEMDELYPQEMFFASLLSAFGIPYQYENSREVSGQVLAISGQYLRNLTTGEIISLFKRNFVILEGSATKSLLDMGLGYLAGITSAKWLLEDTGAYTYEQTENGKIYCGIENSRASAVLVSGDVLSVDYENPLEIMTRFYNSYRQATANGHVIANEHCAIYPFGRLTSFPAMPPMLISSTRQALLQDILLFARKANYDVPPFSIKQPYLNLYCYPTNDGYYIYAVNASTDDVEELLLQVVDSSFVRVTAISSRDNVEREVNFSSNNGIMTIENAIESLEAVLFRLYKGSDNLDEK